MKTPFIFFASVALGFLTSVNAQTFSPISTTGYNLDAVAENTTATSTTGGAIDGSNYVLYSAAYGALYSVSNGLPNTGLISTTTRTYQLQPYTQNNLLYLTALTSGTISLTTPAPFAGLSLLGFATEGNATFDLTLKFTDLSTVTFTNQSFLDWFGTGTPIISGFDRVSRSTGVPANSAGNPKMYNIDLPITCANRLKNVQDLIFQSTSNNARVCVMAVAGAMAPTFSASTLPVTCSGGINGSASITGSNGITPYTYTWSTVPVQNTPIAQNLGTGVYSYSVQDNGGCVVTGSVTVSQSLAPQPNISISSNAYTVCSGTTFTLGASGASTYTWSPGNNSFLYGPPAVTVSTPTLMTYTVGGLTSVNCYLTGSISIAVNPLPAAAFSSAPPALCNNSSAILLSNFVTPTGGTFSGSGVNSGSFTPSTTGTFVITYSRTDANNCSNSATTSVQVFSLAAPQITQPSPFCSNGIVGTITVNPTGGTFSGNGTGANGSFNPVTAGPGTHPVGYTINVGPCTRSASVNVLVNSAPSVSITSTKNFYCKNSPSLFYNASPSGGTFSGPGMNGSSFNPAQATIGNNNIIVYQYTDGNGCSDTASLRITVSACVGIDEVQKSSGLNLFPNPSSGSVNFKAETFMQVAIYNELGQVVQSVVLDENNNFTAQVILAKGIYFADYKAEGLKHTDKIIVAE